MVRWGPVPNSHRNGDITGYSVRYGVQGSGQTAIPFVQGEDSAALQLSGLRPRTLYEIQVAAVNSAGTGVYSNSILQMTTGILIIINNYSIYSYRNRSVSDATETTIAGLVSSTLYEIQVAAVNSAGVGVYSTIVLQFTHGIAS